MTASLLEIRRDLAERHTGLRLVRTGVWYGNAYTGTATGTNARRLVVSSQLATLNRAGTSSEADGPSFNYRWMYEPSAGDQRRVVENGYTGYATASSVLTGNASGSDSEIVGYTLLDRAVDVAFTPDSEIEFHGRFPVLAGEDVPSLHWAIGEALQLMTWPYKLEIDGVSGTQRYDLHGSTIDAWWVTRPEHLIRVYRAETDDTIGGDPMQGRAYLEPDGEHLWLYVPEEVATGETFTAQFNRSAYTYVKRGTWQTMTSGPVYDNDEVLPDRDRVSAVAWAVLARRMAQSGPKPERDGWGKVAAEAEAGCSEFLKVPVKPSTPMRQRRGRVPWNPTGKAWQPMSSVGNRRRWP